MSIKTIREITGLGLKETNVVSESIKSKLKTITVTGADDSVKDVSSLLKISEKYSKVEWGILLSKNNAGSNRFPSHEWIFNLAYHYHTNPWLLDLSAHICGSWVREIFLEGKAEIFDLLPMEIFKRVQFNFHGLHHDINKEAALNILKQKFQRYELIFQFDDVNNELINLCKDSGLNAYPLFDLSGGAGILPDKWPVANGYSGYAGGLSPGNIVFQLTQIQKVCGNNMIWVDAETHLRSNNDVIFDLSKVEFFLKNIYEWILET